MTSTLPSRSGHFRQLRTPTINVVRRGVSVQPVVVVGGRQVRLRKAAVAVGEQSSDRPLDRNTELRDERGVVAAAQHPLSQPRGKAAVLVVLSEREQTQVERGCHRFWNPEAGLHCVRFDSSIGWGQVLIALSLLQHRGTYAQRLGFGLRGQDR